MALQDKSNIHGLAAGAPWRLESGRVQSPEVIKSQDFWRFKLFGPGACSSPGWLRGSESRLRELRELVSQRIFPQKANTRAGGILTFSSCDPSNALEAMLWPRLRLAWQIAAPWLYRGRADWRAAAVLTGRLSTPLNQCQSGPDTNNAHPFRRQLKDVRRLSLSALEGFTTPSTPFGT